MNLLNSLIPHRCKQIELYVDDKKVYSGIGFDIHSKFAIKNNLLWNEIAHLDCTCVDNDDVVKFYVKTVKRTLISRNLYGGKSLFFKGASPYELETRTCSCANVCSLFQKGLCISLKRLSSGFCKYVAKGIERGGYTSKKGQAIRDKYYELKEENPTLLDFDGYFFAVGDEYAFKLVYPNIGILPNGEYKVVDCNSCYNPYKELKWVSRSIHDWAYIPKELVTNEFMEQLLNFKPHTLLGYEVIKEYQDKIVPRIKIDILKYAPELAEKIGLKNVDYVGKLGLIKTLKPNITLYSSNKNYRLYWDGECVTVLNPEKLFHSHSELGEFKEATVKYTPNDKAFGLIEDNSWVLPDTIIKESR